MLVGAHAAVASAFAVLLGVRVNQSLGSHGFLEKVVINQAALSARPMSWSVENTIVSGKEATSQRSSRMNTEFRPLRTAQTHTPPPFAMAIDDASVALSAAWRSEHRKQRFGTFI